ncbi:thymidylate synthase family protein [Streptomyces aculeolatus]
MHDFSVRAADTSHAWQQACRHLMSTRDHRAYHTVVRIERPQDERPDVREGLDHILRSRGLATVNTVANTIFPRALADTSASHEQLVTRYRRAYPSVRRLAAANRQGTYFGRLVAYPGSGADVDQLGNIIERLRRQARGPGGMTAAYELTVTHHADVLSGTDVIPVEAGIRVPGKDNGYRGFPCLSHVSFQLDRTGTVHAAAYYRSHFMLQRAYGNYLGLGRLLGYIARESGCRPGWLTVMAGTAVLETALSQVDPLLNGTPSLFSLAKDC